MKLRAKRSTWKPSATITEYYVQYDKLTMFTQFDGTRFVCAYESKDETIGPFDEKKLESKIVMVMNRRDVVLESIRVVEKKVDGALKRRTFEQVFSAA